MISPLVNEQVEYIYGSQIGGRDSKFSECNLFNKYYGEESQIPQEDFFCNNANSALVRSVWLAFQFDETLTGLEDMELAKRLINNKKKIGYSAEAKVFHLHNETWKQISWRYEREAFALKNIMPEIHVNLWDFLRFTINAIIIDSVSAFKKKIFFKKLKEIILFRIMQYWGTYRGNQEHRKLSAKMKERYFYPG